MPDTAHVNAGHKKVRRGGVTRIMKPERRDPGGLCYACVRLRRVQRLNPPPELVGEYGLGGVPVVFWTGA